MTATAIETTLPGLNSEQSRAATHGDGPLLVIAGAGSGKTRTLAARVAHLVAKGVHPARILLLTFSRQAAKELISRVRPGPGGPVWGGTFHAIGHRLLRMHAEAMGLAPGFTVLDRTDAEDLMDLAREAIGLRSELPEERARPRGRAARFPRKATCLTIYSRCVNSEQPVEAVVAKHFPWVEEHAGALKELFRLYEERKIARSVLDLDDLLVWWQGLMEDPRLGPEVEARFDHVLVDEYQDTNRLQRAILLGLRRTNRNITVVGDDAQAIYGFRAATVRNILDFESDFPGAAVVRLETSYRSTAPILEATNAVIALATERHAKTLRPAPGQSTGPRPVLVRCRDDAAEADLVIAEALARLEEGTLLRNQAVLFRTAHHSDRLELELGRRKIPYRKFGGLRFLDSAHVKDALAFVRIVENPADETAWFRVLKLLDGVGPKTAQRVLEHLSRERFALDSIARCEVPPAARPAWSGLRDLLLDVRALDAAPTLDRIRAFYEPILERRLDHSAARVGDLDALARLAQGAESRSTFLADLTLDPPSTTGDLAGPPVLDEDWLVLSTIHSAKGLEWDAVTILHAADGCIPSDLSTGHPDEIEEERRLFYVALTRAKRWLTVVSPVRFYVPEKQPQDRHVFAPLTRFLPSEVRALFEERTPTEPLPPALTPTEQTRAADAVRARLLARWT